MTEEEQLLKECKSILHELAEAATPFTSGNIVDETNGTTPLMERLDRAIERAKEIDNG